MMCLIKRKRQQILENFDNFKVFNEKIEKDNLIDEILKNIAKYCFALSCSGRSSIFNRSFGNLLNSNLIGTQSSRGFKKI